MNYTPISSFGFNFGYFENIGKIKLSELFGLQGDSSFEDLGYQTKYKAVKRGLMVEGKLLNLNITHIGKKVNFDFNFHYDVTSCLLAKKIISDQIIENKNIAEKILRKVYKLKLDKTKGEEYGNNNLYPKLT